MGNSYKDAIKQFDYFEMEAAYEDTSFSKADIDNIEKKMDELAFEHYDEKKDRVEIPFNKIIRTFFNDAKVYYAIKYCEENEYYIRSFVDINCDSPIYIYQNSFKKHLPSIYSDEKQEQLINEIVSLRSKIFDDFKRLDISLENVSDFSSEKFYETIIHINDQEFNKDYQEYVKLRNELVTHNMRAMMNVSKMGYFTDIHEFEDFYLFRTLEATEKYFKKYYNPDSVGIPQKYFLFLFTYGKYMILSSVRNNSSLIKRNNHLYEKYKKIRRLYDDGFEFDKIAEMLEMNISEVKWLYNCFMPVASLDTEYEYDEDYEEDFTNSLCENDLNNIIGDILSTFDERDRKIILLRFGFVDGECWSLQKIGDEFGLTREGVRKIEKRLIDSLRPLCLDKHLDTYVR